MSAKFFSVKKGLNLGTLTTDPSDGRAGSVYYNSTTNVLRYYNGSTWTNVGSTPTTTKGDLIVRNTTIDTRLPVGTQGQVLTVDSSTAEGVKWAQGSSGVNYIPDNDGSVLGNWVTYADAAGTAPVDGTGGSPTLTFAVSSDTTMRGSSNFLLTLPASNVQGQGFSYPFTIDGTDKAKVLTISFDYQVASGTYVDDKLTCWIYDVTNSVLIQPSQYAIKNAIGIQPQKCEFQTNPNSTSYRLIVHCGSTNAVASTLRFDTFSISPNAKEIQGSKIIYRGQATGQTGITTETTVAFGTATYDTANAFNTGTNKYLIPESGWYRCNASLTYNGLASGEFIRTRWYKNSAVLLSERYTYVTTSDNGGLINDDTFYLIAGDTIYVTAGNNGATFNITDYASLQSSFVTIEKTGGISSLSTQNVVDLQLNNAASITPSATIGTTFGGSTNINFNKTPIKDSNGGYLNGVYTVGVAGDYWVDVATEISHTSSVGSNIVVGIAVNNVLTILGVTKPLLSNAYPTGRGLLSNLKAGDTISIRLFTDTTSPAFVNSTVHNLSIMRLSGPSQIAASESINLGYFNTAGSSVGTGYTAIPFATKDYDTHGAWSSSTFTAPIAGKYRISANLITAVLTLTNVQAFFAKVVKAGSASQERYVGQAAGGGVATTYNVSFSTTFNLLAGDTLQIQAASSVATTLNTTTSFNHVEIERVGN